MGVKMGKFKRWLLKTFTGIYGIDNLYFVLFGISVFFIFLNLFIGHWIIWLAQMLTIAYMLFRALSHNITARRRENEAFFGFFRKIKGFFKLQKNRFHDRKTHIFRKCPKCKAVLRLPKAKGKKVAVCPRCGNHFKV